MCLSTSTAFVWPVKLLLLTLRLVLASASSGSLHSRVVSTRTRAPRPGLRAHSSGSSLTRSLPLALSPPTVPSTMPSVLAAGSPSSCCLTSLRFFFSPAFNRSRSIPPVVRFSLRSAISSSSVSLCAERSSQAVPRGRDGTGGAHESDSESSGASGSDWADESDLEWDKTPVGRRFLNIAITSQA